MPIQDSNHRRMARNRSKEGISPVIATVILIAIAVVLGVAVASYAGGLFSTQSGTGGYYVRAMTLKVDNSGLDGEMIIESQSANNDVITSIDLRGPGSNDILPADIGNVTSDGCTTNEPGILANAINKKCFNNVSLNPQLEPGQTVTVRINLRSGTVLTHSTTVQPP